MKDDTAPRHPSRFRVFPAGGRLTDAEILAQLPAEMSESERQAVLERIQAGLVRSRALHAVAERIAESDEVLSDADILCGATGRLGG